MDVKQIGVLVLVGLYILAGILWIFYDKSRIKMRDKDANNQ